MKISPDCIPMLSFSNIQLIYLQALTKFYSSLKCLKKYVGKFLIIKQYYIIKKLLLQWNSILTFKKEYLLFYSWKK